MSGLPAEDALPPGPGLCGFLSPWRSGLGFCRTQPASLSLFTGVRGRGVLGSRYGPEGTPRRVVQAKGGPPLRRGASWHYGSATLRSRDARVPVRLRRRLPAKLAPCLKGTSGGSRALPQRVQA